MNLKKYQILNLDLDSNAFFSKSGDTKLVLETILAFDRIKSARVSC